MALSTSTPLQDLGTLVLCHHALNLEEQLILGCLSQLAVEKDDLDPSTVQFVNDEDLVGILARQTIR